MRARAELYPILLVHLQSALVQLPTTHLLYSRGLLFFFGCNKQRAVLRAYCNLGSPKSTLSISEHLGVASH